VKIRIWPWSRLHEQQVQLGTLRRISQGQAERIGLGTAENRRLAAVTVELRKQLTAARGASQIRAQEAALLSNATQDKNSVVEFVIVGHDRLGQGKRIMASRDLTGTKLGIAGGEGGTNPKWQISAVMGGMLTTDAPTYEAALARVNQIWANWEREERAAAAKQELGWTDVGPTEGGVTLR
jgi:hypothetical protein